MLTKRNFHLRTSALLKARVVQLVVFVFLAFRWNWQLFSNGYYGHEDVQHRRSCCRPRCMFEHSRVHSDNRLSSLSPMEAKKMGSVQTRYARMRSWRSDEAANAKELISDEEKKAGEEGDQDTHGFKRIASEIRRTCGCERIARWERVHSGTSCLRQYGTMSWSEALNFDCSASCCLKRRHLLACLLVFLFWCKFMQNYFSDPFDILSCLSPFCNTKSRRRK